MSRALAIAPEEWPITLWISCGVKLLTGVVAQVGEDLLAQPARLGGRGLLPAGGGLDRPAGLGGLLVDLVQAGQHGAQVPAAGQHGGGGAGGGLDLPDVPGDLRHQGRVGRGAGGGAAVGGRGGLVLLVAGGCVLAGRAALGRVTLGGLAVGRLAVRLGGLACCGAGIAVGACLGAAGLLLAGAVLLAAGGVVAGLAGDRVLVVLPGAGGGLVPGGAVGGQGPGVRDAGLAALGAGDGAGGLQRGQGVAGGGAADPGGGRR